MRILRIVSAGYEQGGVENGIVLSNDILRQRGHEVRVISSDVRPDLPHYSDYEFHGVPSSGFNKVIAGAFNYDAYKVTRKVLKDFLPDVVLVHTLSQPTAAVLAPLKKFPTILFVHGPEIYTKSLLHWYLKREDYRDYSYNVTDLTFAGRLHYWYFKYICRTFYKLAWNNVDRVVALSSYTLDFLKHERISASYIPNGAKIYSTKPLPVGSPVLLYAGRLEKFKGVDVLIRSLPAIIEQVPQTKLHIAGEGGYALELKQLVNKLGLDEHVTFLGHQNQKQLEESYSKCHIFILPSIWPETFGKVGIEAMSLGRPVVASNVGGICDWLTDGKNGFLVQPNNSRQLADRVIRLLSNEKLLATMASEAQKTATKFSIESFTDNIEHLAKDVIRVKF